MTNTGKDVAKSHMWCETKVRDIKRRKKKCGSSLLKSAFYTPLRLLYYAPHILPEKTKRGKRKKMGSRANGKHELSIKECFLDTWFVWR